MRGLTPKLRGLTPKLRSMGWTGRNLLVGVSGGADSVALFFLLREIGCSFQVLHVHHAEGSVLAW